MNARIRAQYARHSELAATASLPENLARAYVLGDRLAVVFRGGGLKLTRLDRWTESTVRTAINQLAGVLS